MNFIQYIDNNISLYLYNLISNSDIIKNVFSIITHLGDGGFIWIVFSVILFIKKSTRKYGIILIISLLVGLLIGNLFLKNLFERLRPFIQLDFIPLIPKPSGFSFPSGHSLSSFIGATSIFQYNKKFGIFAYILAILIAFSRVLLGVHFLSDIVVGAILGIIISYICNKVFFKYF